MTYAMDFCIDRCVFPCGVFLPLVHASCKCTLLHSELIIDQSVESDQTKNVRLHGALSDGTHYDQRNLLASPSVGRHYSFAGTEPNDWWVKARLEDDNDDTKGAGVHLLSTGEGFNVWNRMAVLS